MSGREAVAARMRTMIHEASYHRVALGPFQIESSDVDAYRLGS